MILVRIFFRFCFSKVFRFFFAKFSRKKNPAKVPRLSSSVGFAKSSGAFAPGKNGLRHSHFIFSRKFRENKKWKPKVSGRKKIFAKIFAKKKVQPAILGKGVWTENQTWLPWFCFSLFAIPFLIGVEFRPDYPGWFYRDLAGHLWLFLLLVRQCSDRLKRPRRAATDRQRKESVKNFSHGVQIGRASCRERG